MDVRIYDFHGRAVRTLVAGVFEAGRHVLTSCGDADGGLRAEPGIHFARGESGVRTFVRKVVRLR